MFHVLTITYVQPPDVIDQIRPAHQEWLRSEVDAGRILLAGRTESGTGGVLLTSDIDAGEAAEIIAADPYSQAKAVDYQRISFTAGHRAPGL